MQADRPLLTIAIPTYNRAQYLSELLHSLLGQLDSHQIVELLVSDNASSDRTSALVDDFIHRGLNIQYVRHEVNIGSDANFLQCFDRARGKYVWLVGDDDILLPGSIAKIVSLISTEDFALIYLTPYPFTDDYLAERQHDKFGRFAQASPNGLQFIKKVGTTIAFISSIIVNKCRYNAENGPELKTLIGSNLIHLGWILPVLGSGGNSLIIWERLLAVRSGNSGGWGICRVFSVSLGQLLAVTLSERKDIVAEIVNGTLKNWFPLMIMQIRGGQAGTLSQENIRHALEPQHGRNWRYWFYVFPVAALPYTAANIWYTATRLLGRGGRLLVLWLSYPLWRKKIIWKTK